MLGVGNIGRMGAVGGSASSGAPPIFSPNLPSGMTLIVDRQWNPTDSSIPGGVLPPPSLSGTDSFGMIWSNGDGASQVPIIATPASLTSTIGQTVPALPDGNPTALAIHYPSGETGGTAPFLMFMHNAVLFRQIYACMYVFMPTGFNTNENNIKWMGVQGHDVTGSANHIFMMVAGGPTDDYRSAWMTLQGGAGNKELGGPGSATDSVTQLHPTNPPPQGSGMGWWASMQGQWITVEFFAQQESVIGSSADGIFKSWVTVPGQASTLVNFWNDLTFNGAGDAGAFNAASFTPYYGGGGGAAPSDQFLLVGRWYVAGGT